MEGKFSVGKLVEGSYLSPQLPVGAQKGAVVIKTFVGEGQEDGVPGGEYTRVETCIYMSTQVPGAECAPV